MRRGTYFKYFSGSLLPRGLRCNRVFEALKEQHCRENQGLGLHTSKMGTIFLTQIDKRVLKVSECLSSALKMKSSVLTPVCHTRFCFSGTGCCCWCKQLSALCTSTNVQTRHRGLRKPALPAAEVVICADHLYRAQHMADGNNCILSSIF